MGEKQNATPERRAQQEAMLAPINLKEEERDVVISILDQFKHDYAQRVSEYNAAVNEANQRNIPPDLQNFLRHRDDLVQITRDSLKSALANESMARFDAYVRSEKRHMMVSKEVQ